MRIAAYPLTLRSEIADRPQQAEGRRDLQVLPPLPPTSGPPAYVSLLVAEPFSVPSILSRPFGPSTISNIPLPRSQSTREEIRLTPESLRYLANVQARLASEAHEVLLACHKLRQRADLQRHEYERLQKKAADIVEWTKSLLGPRKDQLKERLKTIQTEQSKLLGRMDRLLHALVRQASPGLNEHETRWFEELRRMKAQVLGIGRYDPDSLRMRIKQVSRGVPIPEPLLTTPLV